MPKIQIKRGSKAKLPTLAPGEFGLATDAGELYIGGAGKNLHIPVLGDDGKLPPSELPPMDYDPAGSAAAVQKALSAHTGNKNNPHAVTAEQVGAFTKQETLTPETAHYMDFPPVPFQTMCCPSWGNTTSIGGADGSQNRTMRPSFHRQQKKMSSIL